MLDPLVAKTIALGLGVLFTLSAAHKLSAPDRFAGVLADYQVIPNALIATATWLVAVVELALGIGWIIAPPLAAIALASAVLLAVYSAAMGINLARGRVHIGCGCSFAGTDDPEQQLSYGLLGRNAVLIGLALASILPIASRALSLADYLIIAATLIAGTLLYAASNQLLGNGAAIGVWRNRHE